MSSRRPLPSVPPDVVGGKGYHPVSSADIYSPSSPFFSMPYAYPAFTPRAYDPPTQSTLPTGTLLHKGFYGTCAVLAAHWECSIPF